MGTATTEYRRHIAIAICSVLIWSAKIYQISITIAGLGVTTVVSDARQVSRLPNGIAYV